MLISCFFNLLGIADSKSNEDTTTIMVTVMVVGAVLVISLIVFLLYRSRKERHERVNLGRATPVVNPRGLGSIPRISVKDHINKLGTHDLLKSKISINDPKKIRQYPVERIAYEKDLGEGQFGQVFQGTNCERMYERTKIYDMN